MPGKGGDHGRPGRQQRMRALILASLPTGPFADALKTRDILADKGFLLRDRPAFQLALTLHRFFGRVELFGIYDPDGSSGGGIACAVAGIVRVFSCGEIFGVADVQRSVSTAGDIDPSHWTTMSSSRGAAQDLDWAFGRGPSTRRFAARSGHSTSAGVSLREAGERCRSNHDLGASRMACHERRPAQPA